MKFTILITMLLGSHVNRITHILHSSHGLNLSRGHVIVDSIQVAKCEAADCGVELRAAQIFVGGPRQRVITMTPEDSQALYEFTQENHFKVFAHSAYVAPPWGGDPDAARFIRKELKVCESAGIAGLIVHLPKAPIETVIKYIPRLLNPEVGSKVRIYFETPAVRPEESYYETPEKLAALFDALRAFDADQSLFGLCVDTAHLWTCGVDISSRESAEDWLQRLEKLIPPSITIIHANDSQRPLGVGPDMHAGLADGKIWSNYALHMKASGIAAFITYADKHKLPFILERNSKEKLLNDYHIIEKLEPSVRIKAYKKCPIIGKSVDIFAGNSSKMAANFPLRTLFDHILDRKTQERVRFFITAVGKRAAASLHTTPDLLAEKVISIMEKSQLSDVEVLQRLFDLFKKVGEPSANSPANSPANLPANLPANSPPSIHTKIKENRKKSRVSDIEVELELVKASKAVNADNAANTDNAANADNAAIADNAANISYLDIGCSEGNITSAIAEYLHLTPQQAFACDIMPLKIANDSFTFAQSSATALPYDSDSFDFITMFMSAHHFTDIDAMISEVYRVARNGAFLLMREHCLPADKDSSAAYYDISHAIYACTAIARPLPVENTPEEFMADYHRPGGFAQYRNLEQWTKILESHGFIPVMEPHGPVGHAAGHALGLAGPGRGNRMAQRGPGREESLLALAGPGRGNRDSSRPGPARPAARANIDSSRPGPARAAYVYDTMFDAIYMLFCVEKKEKDILDEIIEDFTAASGVKSECGCDA